MKRCLLKAQVNVLDDRKGISEYVASDQSVDNDREIVRAKGWRFDDFAKNSPFVDSHNYSSIEFKLGEVVDYKIAGDQLIETVQWLIDVPEHRLATIGWKLTQAGMPPACSVGFLPVKAFNKSSAPSSAWRDACAGVSADAATTLANRICWEQQQKELSAAIIGCNANAVAKSYKAGVITDADLETLSTMQAKRETASMTADPADVIAARQRARTAFLMEMHTLRIKQL